MRKKSRAKDWAPVSVIVHNFKGTNKLERCLSSIVNSDYPMFEIIVVDGLTEGIEDWIQRHFPMVKLIHFNYDGGIPARLNAAFASVNTCSKYIARLDDDMAVHKKWLHFLVGAMEHDPTIGFAQSLLLKAKKRKQVDCLGGFLDRVGYTYLYPFDSKTGGARALDDIREISYAIAGLMRREALDRLSTSKKPFDDDYFIHWYDIDLSWRIQLAGYKVVLIPSSIVYHERRLTSGRSNLLDRNIFLNTRNRMMTLIKNYSLWNLIWYFSLRVLFEAAEVIALLRKRPDHARATVHGILWVLRNFKSVWKKRIFVQNFIRKVPDSHIFTRFVRINPLQLYRDFQRHYPEVS